MIFHVQSTFQLMLHKQVSYYASDMITFLVHIFPPAPATDYERQRRLRSRIRDIGINATRRVICYDQPIFDDMRLEPPEYFGMTLIVQEDRTRAKTDLRPMYDQVAILILDDDGEKKLVRHITNHVIL